MPRVFPKGEKTESAEIPAEIPKVVHDVYILDGSTSMAGSKFRNAVKGINEDLKASVSTNKELNITGTYSIYQFSTFLQMHSNENVTMRNTCEFKEYHTTILHGATRLYSSVGDVISYFMDNKKKGEKVLIKIFTDGQNYMSRGDNGVYADPKDLATLIEKAEAQDFTITFVGTPVDVQNIINLLKIKKSNTMTHNNTAEDVTRGFNETRDASIKFRKSYAAGESVSSNFYAKSTD